MFAIVESYRYGFYFLKQINLDRTPIGKFFGFLRYNLFLICYPIGAGSEVMALYFAGKMIKKTDSDLYTVKMPNKFNFMWDTVYFMYFMIPIYGVIFPKIYR